MADRSRIYFQENQFQNWMEDGLSSKVDSGVTAAGASGSDLGHRPERKPEEAPAAQPAQSSESAAQAKPTPRRMKPKLHLEDLRLHDWIHGTGEEVPPENEEEDEQLGL